MKIIDINGRERECVRAYLDPNWPGFVTVDFKSRHRPGFSHTEWMPTQDFFEKNPDLKGKITNDDKPLARPKQVAGEVSSSTPNSLTDKTKSWTPNDYAGMFAWISRGKGEGQTRIILSNTKTKVVVDKPWDIRPNNTSQYSLVYNRPTTPASNNTLPIVEMRKLEEKARKFDLERGITPAPRQYTEEKKRPKN